MPEGDERERIRARGLELGFDVVRFARAALPDSTRDNLRQFLADGRHGDMDWLARNHDRRENLAVLWPQARSAIVVGMNYGPPDDLLERGHVRTGAISVYAQGDDYHDVLKSGLKQLGQFVAQTFNADVKIFVDTAPVMEKPLAQEAGLGWQGKHTNLVSREFGSWLFLGSLLTTMEIPPDARDEDHCGSCRSCLDACPTHAFTAPYRMDARRCISYLTIEHKGHVPREFREKMGDRIYGCDDCLAVCPWNGFASVAREARFHARAELKVPSLSALSRLDDAAFRALFRKSPVKRIGRDRFVRNVMIAIGNSGEPTLAEDALRLVSDPSPLVRAMAVWALRRLLPTDEFVHLRAQRWDHELDAEVRAEWDESPSET
ncbi:MAG TPA: tRNA epoxyqueuosine(34) reductase QueG [Rhizomicrobium sp.]|jgi:epoxyqueuosine reductase|nr:tRNA epoxyqueuosine(34) reductase QueG [Rhizomicrobium sp.]